MPKAYRIQRLKALVLVALLALSGHVRADGNHGGLPPIRVTATQKQVR